MMWTETLINSHSRHTRTIRPTLSCVGEIYSMGEDGEEPPAPVRRQMELYRQVRATPDSAEQAALLGEILAIAKEEFYVIGISSAVGGYGIVRDDVHNVPKSILGSAYFITPAPSNTCQYFIES